MNGRVLFPALVLALGTLAACTGDVVVTTAGNGGGGSGGNGNQGGVGGTGGSGGDGGATGGTGGTPIGGAGGSTAGAGGSAAGAGGSAGGAAGAGGAPPGCQGLGDACSDCAFMDCSAQYCACYDDLACGTLVFCLQGCAAGDTACQQQCLTANEDGISHALLLSGCSAAQCPNECPGSLALDPCSECLFTDCSSEMNACLANPDCNAIIQCAQACPPNGMLCQLQCVQSNPNGQQDFQQVYDCLNQNCAMEC